MNAIGTRSQRQQRYRHRVGYWIGLKYTTTEQQRNGSNYNGQLDLTETETLPRKNSVGVGAQLPKKALTLYNIISWQTFSLLFS